MYQLQPSHQESSDKLGRLLLSLLRRKTHLPLKDRLWQEVCVSDWPPSKEVLRVTPHPVLLFLFKPLQDTSMGKVESNYLPE